MRQTQNKPKCLTSNLSPKHNMQRSDTTRQDRTTIIAVLAKQNHGQKARGNLVVPCLRQKKGKNSILSPHRTLPYTTLDARPSIVTSHRITKQHRTLTSTWTVYGFGFRRCVRNSTHVGLVCYWLFCLTWFYSIRLCCDIEVFFWLWCEDLQKSGKRIKRKEERGRASEKRVRKGENRSGQKKPRLRSMQASRLITHKRNKRRVETKFAWKQIRGSTYCRKIGGKELRASCTVDASCVYVFWFFFFGAWNDLYWFSWLWSCILCVCVGWSMWFRDVEGVKIVKG